MLGWDFQIPAAQSADEIARTFKATEDDGLASNRHGLAVHYTEPWPEVESFTDCFPDMVVNAVSP